MEKIPLVEQTFANDKKSITLCYPNVRYAKEKHLLRKARPMTYEMSSYNMELCGFDVVSYEEFRGAHTKITAKCSNVDCEDVNEKIYSDFITKERYPLCKSCQPIVRGINRSNKRPIVAIKSAEKIEFESVAQAARHLNITPQNVYNHVKKGTPHSSGYRFEFLD
ncbi:hypothetical protein COK21_27810 [Bacillus cereus]|nr:hypothetical protein COK21_27810 [Bacillus cereus]